ncbi:origin recognition complex subunit 3 [Brachionus plicatilis]|uniref:Origin recognition complex subunit 3 n=1 Tax=Brachionus plicatilis TaxID=10195 RepID=A0A3M7SAG9_BRAPC|nr:origin recognition complex subunit 3 [Brachionus plicatilis]
MSLIARNSIFELKLDTDKQIENKNILFIDESMLFKISGDIFKFLMEIYNDYNYSISSFIHALKFCFFDHIQKNDLNALFVTNELEDINTFEALIQKLNQNDLNKASIKSICSDLNENCVSICVQQVQKKWHQFNNQFVLLCHMLYEIVKNFPSVQDESSLYTNRSFIQLYNKTKKFSNSEQFMDLKKLLQLSSLNTINDIVSSFINLIKTRCFNHESSFNAEFLNDLHDFYELMEKMKQKFTIQNCDTSFNEDDEVLAASNTDDIYDIDSKVNQLEFMADLSPKSLVSRKSSVRTLKVISENSPSKPKSDVQTKMLNQHQRKAHTAKILNNFKQCMINWLSEQFSYFDNDYSADLPFSDYFCYSNFDRVKKRMFDEQRLNMHECLLNSFGYLKMNGILPENVSESPRKKMKNSRKSASKSPVNVVDLDSAMLPLNIAYKLYLECGHMINLFDWFQAFVDRLDNVGLDELSESRKKQALFFRTITELQFMGFIKPTSRKVDHVIKLTNGSSLLAYE